VRFAVMCPATELWQATIRQITLRLMNEYDVPAVYIDQVACAAPVLCFDHAHGHPTGGGHWWVESYYALMAAIRRAKPAEGILTSECNAEPYAKGLDGYLAWDWCADGQVPAFPAVYGGAIQMFGRSYDSGKTENLALRMKAGQQFVFGEQIGWFKPSVVDVKENVDFLRQVVGLRWQLRRYFYAGEMARPPKLHGSINTVRADWGGNHGLVTTEAVMTGAWTIPGEHRGILLFANVGDQSVAAELPFNAADYCISGKQVKVATITPAGRGESVQLPTIVRRALVFPPRSAFVLELTQVKE